MQPDSADGNHYELPSRICVSHCMQLCSCAATVGCNCKRVFMRSSH